MKRLSSSRLPVVVQVGTYDYFIGPKCLRTYTQTYSYKVSCFKWTKYKQTIKWLFRHPVPGAYFGVMGEAALRLV